MPIKVKRSVSDHKGVIGGSQIGATLGISKYQSVHDVWMSFMGMQKEVTEAQQEIFDMGHELEDFIAKQVERIFGVKVRRSNFAYVHPEADWLICHPDRIITGKTEDGKVIGLEIKSSSSYDNARWGEADTDNIPADYLCQCHSYIMTGVCDEVWLVRFSNNRITRYVIKKDEALEADILKKLTKVVEEWKEGVEPPIEDFEEAKKYYTRDTSGDIEATKELIEVVNEWETLKKESKELEARIDAKKAIIVSFMKDKSTLVDNLGNKLATYSKITSERFDSKSFKKDHPEMYSKYSKESSYMKLV